MTQAVPGAIRPDPIRGRFRSRLSEALCLARTQRFAEMLEPASRPDDAFSALTSEFRAWRLALRQGDDEKAMDSLERAFSRIERLRIDVVSHDARIEAFRVRWACENAALSFPILDALGRFYRTLPMTQASQSKYEYVLTRLLAGPIGPERRLVSSDELREIVGRLEDQWSASPLTHDDASVGATLARLEEFRREALSTEDAATFTAGALLRRFGTFKASLGASLFDRRISVAVVETNVAVLNVLNRLLTDAGGRPQSSPVARTRTDAIKRRVLKERPVAASAPPDGVPDKVRGDLKTGEVDLSGLEFRKGRKRSPEPASPVAGDIDQGAPSPAEATSGRTTSETQPKKRKPEIRTGEVDLSGLDLEPLRRSAGEAVHGSAEGDDSQAAPEAEGMVPSGAARSRVLDGPAADSAQQPSLRAREIGKAPEHAALIERYLSEPRSPEIWQLDIDAFLSPLPSGRSTDGHAADRKRALELIIDSDDLVCMRLDDESQPSAEYKSHVNLVAGMMLSLRTGLHRAIEAAPVEARDLEALLYVSDHLLWARLRLETSLKRTSKRPRSLAAPRDRKEPPKPKPAPKPGSRARDRRTLMMAIGVAAGLTTLIAVTAATMPRQAVDPDVRVLDVRLLPNAEVFEDVRAFEETLYVSAGRTWELLRPDQRRQIVRALGSFAAERRLVSVTVIGPSGESLGSFRDGEALLAGEFSDPEAARASPTP